MTRDEPEPARARAKFIFIFSRRESKKNLGGFQDFRVILVSK
jgi:hypothetical protein